MNHIKVWCEYDINGQFGGNNNEDVFAVPDSATNEEVSTLVCNFLTWIWDDVKEEDEQAENIIDAGLAGWEYIVVQELK